MMHQFFVMFWVLTLASNTVLAVPVFTKHKRQSDQRIAELETLLAMHKYGVGQPRRVGGRNSAGYGLIDFNYIGRRKKSTIRSEVGEDGILTRSTSGGLLQSDMHLSKNNGRNGNILQQHFRKFVDGATMSGKQNQNYSGFLNGLSQLPPLPAASSNQNPQLSLTHKGYTLFKE